MDGRLMKFLTKKSGLLGICIVAILLCAIFGSLISSNGGKVNINEIYIDARGGIMNATLYTPLGVTSEDSLPAILINHGAGVSHGIMAGISEELARRGFVVLNVSTYGSGSSENPKTRENVEGFASPQGLYDALCYLRTLQYVDQTRIGITGHSAGSRRAVAVAEMDASPYTLNDMMINALYEVFGQSFTEEEISMDADTLAVQRLSKDQLVYYNAIKADNKQYLNTRMKAVLAIGGNSGLRPREVKLAGYTVTRALQINGGFSIGRYNEGSASLAEVNLTRPDMMSVYQTGGEKIQPDIWYVVQEYGSSSKAPISVKLGNVSQLSITTSAALASAIENRQARTFFIPPVHHSQDFFSPAVASCVVKFFEQTLGWNNGNLGSPGTNPLDASKSIFMVRETLNGLSCIILAIALYALAMILLDTKFFAIAKFPLKEPVSTKRSKPFWIITVIFVAVSCWAIKWAGQNGMGLNFRSYFFSIDSTVNILLSYIVITAVVALVCMLVYGVYLYKKTGENLLVAINVKIKPLPLLKTFLLAYTLFGLAYLSMCILMFFFHQDYRYWMFVLTKMTPQNFMLMFRYGLIVFPTFLIGGALINFGRMKDMKEGWNTALNVTASCIGIFLTAIISYGYMYIQHANGNPVIPPVVFISTWPLLLAVPLTAYLNRKLYMASGSIWLGAFVNTFIITWVFASSLASSGYYLIGNLVTKWLGFGN